jgi:ABC-type multidrug transport system fused ATPase/permease subunit
MKAVREDNDDHDGEGFDGGRHASEEPADDETSLPAPSAADPPLDLPPFRSYNRFRANSRGRFNHLQRLWLKKQIKKSLARDSNADLAALVGELSLRQADDDRGEQADSSLGHHGEGPCVVDPGVVSELRLQVKDELRRNELLAKNRELEKRLRRSDILSYLGRTEYPLEVRVLNFTFEVAAEEDNRAGDLSGGGSDPYRIRTVFNSSFVYPVWLWLSDLWRGGCDGRRRRRRRGRRYTTKRVLDNINLIFEPGKSYLLLGPPGSGRTSLLRAITGILHETDIGATRGAISYNGRTLDVGG